MFDANRVLIDAFVSTARRVFRETYPGVSPELDAGLERAARTALTTLRNCDCPYHHELAARLPACELTEIEASGHLMQEDAPQANIAAALRFFAS
jgi:pimeloyl-ACP methyl ester carboxylesterase